jgi:hypothetical protein
MSQSDKVPNISGPVTPQEAQKNAPVDPDKFKRLLKVEESDETQKRHKRNLKKQEEGDEEEGVEGPTPQAGVFQDLLQASKKSSIYEVSEPLSLPKLAAQQPQAQPPTTQKPLAAQQALNMQQQINQVPQESTGEFFFTPSLGTTAQAPLSDEVPQEVVPTNLQSKVTTTPPVEVTTAEPTSSNLPTPSTSIEITPPSIPTITGQETTSTTPPTTSIKPSSVTTEKEALKPPVEEKKKPTLPKEIMAPMPAQKGLKKETVIEKEKKPILDLKIATDKKIPIPKEEIVPDEVSKKPPLEEKTLSKPIEEPSPKKELEPKSLAQVKKVDIALEKKPATPPALIKEAETKKAPLKEEPLIAKQLPQETIGTKKEIEKPKEPLSTTEEIPPITIGSKETIKETKPAFSGMESLLKKISHKETPLKVQKAKSIEEMPFPASGIIEEKEMKLTEAESTKVKASEKSKEKEAIEENTSMPLVAPLVEVTPTSQEAFVYSRLNPEVFEIFQKMVGMLTIQKDTGVSTTTVTINKPGSIFNEGKLVLEHYDTAPHAFNVQFMGQDKAVSLFNDNLTDLIAAIQHAKLSYQVNIRRAVLAPRYRVETKEDLTKETKK